MRSSTSHPATPAPGTIEYLKAVTGGQGSYTVEFANYDVVPPNVQQQVVAQYNPKAEED